MVNKDDSVLDDKIDPIYDLDIIDDFKTQHEELKKIIDDKTEAKSDKIQHNYGEDKD